MFTMGTQGKSEAKPLSSNPVNVNAPGIATASAPNPLAALDVNPGTGLTRAEVDVRRKQYGYNEVPERKRHPVLKFLSKFWESRRGCWN
jgi:H+-transporting ATPase